MCCVQTTSDGRLLHEMILVCDAYRKDLQHPNEFIRGSTLRFDFFDRTKTELN